MVVPTGEPGFASQGPAPSPWPGPNRPKVCHCEEGAARRGNPFLLRFLSELSAGRRAIRLSPLRGNVRLLRRDEHCSSACPTRTHVGGRFVNRPYGGRGNPLPHLSQATAELGTSHAARASGSSPAGGGTSGGRGRRPAHGRARLSDTGAGRRAADRRPCAKPGRRMARRPGVLSILCFYHWVFLFRFAAQLSYTRRMMTTIRMQKKIWAL